MLKSVNLLVVVMLSLVVTLSTADVPHEEWVATFDGPAHLADWGTGVGVDLLGNVYVAGTSETAVGTYIGDYLTIAYTTGGTELWVATYDGPAGDDHMEGMAVDPAGNVYVTGESYGAGTLLDYATVMYDATGSELWVARYNGPGGRGDEASSVALHGDGGACVTGRSYGSTETDYDYATIRYGADGTELWVARYSNEPVIGEDEALAVAVGPGGSVFVTGHSWGDVTVEDYATAKYSPDGDKEWVARYNGPSDGADIAEAIAVDGAGNVYVTGRSWSDAAEYDYATIKYDSDGNEKWVARYDGPSGRTDLAWDIAVDGDGCVIVTGSSHAFGWDNHDYATVKYDGDGNQIWASLYDGPVGSLDSARALALDSSGNIYVTGNSTDHGTWVHDYATVKYDVDGNEEWALRYGGPSDGTDAAVALAVDDKGVYVTGHVWNDLTQNDCTTIKYSSELTPVEGIFYAVAVDSCMVMLRWSIPSLQGVEGFNLYRAADPDAPLCRINVGLLDAASPGAYEDDSVWPGGTFLYELRAVIDGVEDIVMPGTVTATTDGALPTRLHAASPNPFTDETSLQFDVHSHADQVRIAVYDIAGRFVATLVDGRMSPGRHHVSWDGRTDAGVLTASGVYVVRLDVDGWGETRKVVSIR